MNVKNITDKERRKYEKIWKAHDYRSNKAEIFADLLFNSHQVYGRCLDIGCGDGITVRRLLEKKIDCHGVDITLNGIDAPNVYSMSKYTEAPAWAMPFPSDSFDFSFSTDVLEHLPPELVQRSIAEISRITGLKTIHQISTRPAVKKYSGYEVHLTVQPLEWWERMFRKYCMVPYELCEA